MSPGKYAATWTPAEAGAHLGAVALGNAGGAAVGVADVGFRADVASGPACAVTSVCRLVVEGDSEVPQTAGAARQQ